MSTKWGIAGCGKISNDFVTSWRALPAENHTLVAAAARSLKNAEEFVKKHGGKKAYGSYQELADDKDIDVVYVGVIHVAHLEVATMMLEAGKNVLCEKPIGLNLEQTKKIIELARNKKLFLMEALWSRCLPAYRELKRRITDGELGDIQAVHTTFGQHMDMVERIWNRSLGGGVILDIGIYAIQLILFAFNGEMPSQIDAAATLNDNNSDESVSVSMKFSSGKFANFFITNRVKLPNVGYVIGSKGTVELPIFWCTEHLKSLQTGDFDGSFHDIDDSEFNFTNSQGLMYEAEEVRNCLKNGKLESDQVSHDDTLKTAKIMQNILEQIGCPY